MQQYSYTLLINIDIPTGNIIVMKICLTTRKKVYIMHKKERHIAISTDKSKHIA